MLMDLVWFTEKANEQSEGRFGRKAMGENAKNGAKPKKSKLVYLFCLGKTKFVFASNCEFFLSII